ncbi:MAG: Hpt domain-containing protein [Candidatus Anammoxibacter sp.]
MEEMDDILKEFITETTEGLEGIDQDLITFEKTPDDRPLLDQIFRSIHTIKGGSGFLDLGRVESVAHYSENILSKIRDGKLNLDSTIMNVLLEAIDALKDIVSTIESTGNEGENDYKDIAEGKEAVASSPSAEPDKEAPDDKHASDEAVLAKNEKTEEDVAKEPVQTTKPAPSEASQPDKKISKTPKNPIRRGRF